MPIVQTKAIEQDGPRIGDIIVICIRQKKKIGRLADVNPAIAQQQARGEVQAIREDRDLVGTTVIVRVLQDFDAVTRLGSRWSAQRIFVQLEHPEASAAVPGHGYGVYYVRLGGE